MSQHAEFKIAYDGDALRTHSMDVRDLAPALLSLGQLFDEANRVLNGDKTTIKLQVKAHEAGSFEIVFDLYQSLSSQVSQFLTSEFVTSAINLKELVIGGAGLIYLIKRLKGGKPKKLTDLKNGMIRIEFENQTFDVPVHLLSLYQDLAVRNSVNEVIKPLQRDGIDLFQVKDKGKVVDTVQKSDSAYFSVPEIEDEKIVTSENEAAYSIVSLAFKDDNKWRLYDGSSTINVTMSDDDFKRKVDQHIISFSKGDILRCKVKTTQWRTAAGLKIEYEVLEVKNHILAARQLSLFGLDQDQSTTDGNAHP